MTENFDDFVRWREAHADTTERIESLANEARRMLGEQPTAHDMFRTLLMTVDDLVLINMRAYHEWLRG